MVSRTGQPPVSVAMVLRVTIVGSSKSNSGGTKHELVRHQTMTNTHLAVPNERRIRELEGFIERVDERVAHLETLPPIR